MRLNAAVVPKKILDFLTLWPSESVRPVVSSLNATTGTVVANAAIVPAGTGGSVDAYVTEDTDLIVDVNGYFGYLTLWPAGAIRPTVSTLNAVDGALASNAAIVPAGTNGAISAFGSETFHLLLEINGYFAP